ncbi:nuclear transport factor 2 family protein [Spirillospora sp. NPDC052242]
MGITTERDLADFLRDYPREMVAAGNDPGDVLDRYFEPDFEWRTDDVVLDRRRVIEHARPARKNALEGDVEVHGVLVDGDRFAAHTTMRTTMRKGGVLVTESQMFGRLGPDGRIRRIDQLNRMGRDGD